MPKRVKLTLEELKKAEPLPHFWDENWEVEDPTILAWVINNADKWKPRRVESKGRWIEPIEHNGFKYLGAIWLPDGKIYLADTEAFSIMSLANGERTASDIIYELISTAIEELPKEDELRKAVESGNIDEKTQKLLNGLFALYYRHLAMLKEKRLIN